MARVKDPVKYITGKTIKSVETEPYRAWMRIEFTDGTQVRFRAYEESMMFNDRWSAIDIVIEK